MKTPKHTKGPWSIEVIEGEQIYIFSQEGSQGECVAVVADREMDFDGSRNAHLIAAAPEMLEMLELILNIRENGDSLPIVEIDSIIKKARGES